MNSAIEQMLKSYHVENIYDRKNAMKEIMQEIVLCGLSRAGFFKKAAFYGGTALRIFYGLDRFSEDLDFSLEAEDLDFDLTAYFPVLENVPFPVSWTVKMKKKQKETQDILSYHTQAAGCSDKARAKASGGRQPIEECGRTGL